uniref:Uncharacterized protein n=1 Tax=Knipowitschia caucasica TaxID=637954 RepID=A0AAV2L2P5_KNICA
MPRVSCTPSRSSRHVRSPSCSPPAASQSPAPIRAKRTGMKVLHPFSNGCRMSRCHSQCATRPPTQHHIARPSRKPPNRPSDDPRPEPPVASPYAAQHLSRTKCSSDTGSEVTTPPADAPRTVPNGCKMLQCDARVRNAGVTPARAGCRQNGVPTTT